MKRRETASRATAAYATGRSSSEMPDYPSDLADLTKLDQAARAVVYFHDVYGYSFSEISTALDTPESTCRQIASRERRQLRNRSLRNRSMQRRFRCRRR